MSAQPELIAMFFGVTLVRHTWNSKISKSAYQGAPCGVKLNAGYALIGWLFSYLHSLYLNISCIRIPSLRRVTFLCGPEKLPGTIFNAQRPAGQNTGMCFVKKSNQKAARERSCARGICASLRCKRAPCLLGFAAQNFLTARMAGMPKM